MKKILLTLLLLIIISIVSIAKTQEQLFAEWQAPPNNVPAALCIKLLGRYPLLLNDANPVTWTQIEVTYKASFAIMGEPSVVVLGSGPNGYCILSVQQKCSQEYLPESIKNSIKELYPTWSGMGVYSSPVVRIRVTIITNGAAVPNIQDVYNIPGMEASFIIDFDTPAITNEALKQTVAYRIKSTVNVTSKAGVIQ